MVVPRAMKTSSTAADVASNAGRSRRTCGAQARIGAERRRRRGAAAGRPSRDCAAEQRQHRPADQAGGPGEQGATQRRFGRHRLVDAGRRCPQRLGEISRAGGRPLPPPRRRPSRAGPCGSRRRLARAPAWLPLPLPLPHAAAGAAMAAVAAVATALPLPPWPAAARVAARIAAMPARTSGASPRPAPSPITMRPSTIGSGRSSRSAARSRERSPSGSRA